MTTSSRDHRTKAALLEENEQLRARLDEAEQTLNAIRSGDVDALVVAGPQGDQVFSLTGAERTYRLIIETMNEAALTVDLAGTILFCNQRFAGLTKCAIEEIIGRKLTAFVGPSQQSLLQKLMADAQAGPTQRSLALRAADGGVVSVQLAASALVDAGNTSLCLVASDLTELEGQADSIRVLLEHQRALEESKAELQAANADLLQSRLAVLNVSEDAIAARRQVEELNSHLQREVIEHKKAKEELSESEGKFRALADSIPNLAWRANGEGYITWYNQRWYKYTGTTLAQMEGWGWQSVHDPVELPKVLEHWQASITTGEPFDMTFPLLGADGVFRPFLTRVIPLKDAAGCVQQWIGTNTDVSEMTRVEQELRESEERLKMVLRASSMGTFEVNFQTGEGQWNDDEFRLLGLKPGDAPSNPETFFQYVHPNDVETLKAKWEEALLFGELDAEFRIVRADGQERWLAGKGKFLYEGNAKNQAVRFLGVNFDISERKQAEEAIHESETKYRNLFENMTEEVHFWKLVRDEAGRIKTWELVDANPPTLKSWARRTLDEIKGKTTDEIFGPGATDHYMPVVQKIMTDGVPFVFEDFFPLLNKHFRFTSVPLGDFFITTGADITAHKQALASLQESEQQFRVLLQNLHSAVALVNEHGEFSIVNQSFLRVFDLADDSNIKNVNDRDWSQWQVFDEHGALLDVDEHPVRKVALTGRPVRDRLVAVKAPESPNLKWLLVSAEPFSDDQGHAYRLICTYYDITKHKQAEEEIKTALAEKEVMLKEIHHRVKNNLQVISSLVSLQSDHLTDERLRDEFNDVRDRVSSMALIHEKLYQTNDLARLNFADYATSLLRSLWHSHSTLAEQVRLTLALTPVALSIEAAVPCGLILNELAGNALKHAFPHNSDGEVTVGLEHDATTGTVCLRVRDNGVGLPEGLDWRQSRSLGLRLVQILAGQLGGTLETGPGPGTEFQIVFPAKGSQSCVKFPS